MQVTVYGAGAVGARAARQLAETPGVRVAVADRDGEWAAGVVAALGGDTRVVPHDEVPGDAAVVIFAFDGDQRPAAEGALAAGVPVVSVSDEFTTVRQLLDLDAEATERGLPLVVGAGFSPGLACLLAAHAAATFDVVEEIHVAKVGTGGPACARVRHRALRSVALEWRDGAWERRRGGSGRELCWFPDPVGGIDCYRAATPEPLLLAAAFPAVRRVSARVGANRRDRLGARLPMLRRPRAEGGPGALRVEVRGRRGGSFDTYVLGAMDRPALAAGTVAAVAAVWAAEGRLRPGAGGLASLADALLFLRELAQRGVRAAVFEGAAVGT